MTRNPSYPPCVEYDNCEHDWDEATDSMWTGPHQTDVTCKKCGCPGARSEPDGDVYWPAT